MICELERDGNKLAIICHEVYGDHNYYDFSVDAIIIITDKATMVFDAGELSNKKIEAIMVNPRVAILEEINEKRILKVFT